MAPTLERTVLTGTQTSDDMHIPSRAVPDNRIGEKFHAHSTTRSAQSYEQHSRGRARRPKRSVCAGGQTTLRRGNAARPSDIRAGGPGYAHPHRDSFYG